MILIAARGLQKEEEEAIQSAGRYAKAKLVVIHQSDERNNHSVRGRQALCHWRTRAPIHTTHT